MSDVESKIVTREEFNRELVQALDELVAAGKYHGELIKEAFARGEEVTRRADAWRAKAITASSIAKEASPPYGEIPERLDRIERALMDIRERMATKVELEETNENVKRMADGYMTIGQRLDAVANLLKLRF